MRTSDATSWIENTSRMESAGVQQAIISMQASLRQYDIKHCEYCFRLLQTTMETIIEKPHREEASLKSWSTMMRLQQQRKDCNLCKPPVF